MAVGLRGFDGWAVSDDVPSKIYEELPPSVQASVNVDHSRSTYVHYDSN